ncbi:hypothetical protein CHS0354_005346 [Potamilus streckersoni]|uniref:Uncharacterized protein n=1 Tax=Potamilus streckersoni TaxID=2493646 RepID=A0AAE0VVE9_9BIVA|nr:hypothetical protein CHS0354_005346 [Potamilus streckersoni]
MTAVAIVVIAALDFAVTMEEYSSGVHLEQNGDNCIQIEDGIDCNSSFAAGNTKFLPDKNCGKFYSREYQMPARRQFRIKYIWCYDDDSGNCDCIETYECMNFNSSFTAERTKHRPDKKYGQCIIGAIQTAVRNGVTAALDFVFIMEEYNSGVHLERNEDFMVVC